MEGDGAAGGHVRDARGGAGDGTGRLIAGRYRVTGELGRGGMGVVRRARDELLGRDVAVKALRTYTDARGGELDGLQRRMQREAQAAARVRHPGVVAVHDIVRHEGSPVIVMELVEGPSLDDVLKERGPISPEEAAHIGSRVLDALAAAHRAGVLHRDVKPGNILLENGSSPDGRAGRVVLTDFGIAAVKDADDGGSALTGSGELVGSLDYLAPERARGEDPGPASDLWSLGATLYAAVEGASPFRHTSTWSTLTALVSDPLPPPVRAGELTPVLTALLEKDPARRADAARAARLLKAALSQGTPGAPTRRTARLRPLAPRRPAVHPTGPVAEPLTSTSAGGRGRRTFAVTGAVVLLACAGVAYAVIDHGPGTAAAPSQGPSGSAAAGAGPSASPGRDPSVPPPCRDIGSGRFSCETWRDADSYDRKHLHVGTLHAGRNYFFCQLRTEHRETSGEWTNVWWAQTDDDSGNHHVLVSAVYLKGGDNDEPVPGLPVCRGGS